MFEAFLLRPMEQERCGSACSFIFETSIALKTNLLEAGVRWSQPDEKRKITNALGSRYLPIQVRILSNHRGAFVLDRLRCMHLFCSVRPFRKKDLVLLRCSRQHLSVPILDRRVGACRLSHACRLDLRLVSSYHLMHWVTYPFIAQGLKKSLRCSEGNRYYCFGVVEAQPFISFAKLVKRVYVFPQVNRIAVACNNLYEASRDCVAKCVSGTLIFDTGVRFVVRCLLTLLHVQCHCDIVVSRANRAPQLVIDAVDRHLFLKFHAVSIIPVRRNNLHDDDLIVVLNTWLELAHLVRVFFLATSAL